MAGPMDLFQCPTIARSYRREHFLTPVLSLGTNASFVPFGEETTPIV